MAANPLPIDDYKRYGRQMVLAGIGLPGQLKLKEASVAVVGAGGLGCPALQYLAAAGVGTIGVVDHDSVETSNLQRQILHTESHVGSPKALSAADAIKRINSRINVVPHTEALTSSNAMALLEPYDVILDCTDNLPTRYLLSDTAVRLMKPLVSGAAQQFDGQLSVYNLPLSGTTSGPLRGPCFRCLFPKPPAPENAGSCQELGILGAVTGVIGVLQATETIKIITGLHDGRPTMLMYNALTTPCFRSIRLRTRRPTCPACGTAPEWDRVGTINETDYVAFCGGPRPDWVRRGMSDAGDTKRRISAKGLKDALSTPGKELRIIDVRPPTEFGMCHLQGSLNIPLRELVASPTTIAAADQTDSVSSTGGNDIDEITETYLVCRLGNDSQIAADALRSVGLAGVVKDLVGGLRAWSAEVDPEFPVY